MNCRSVLAPMLARRVISQCCVSGCLSPFALESGCMSPSLAVCALLCWCALAAGVAVGSLHDSDPMQADEPPIMRGDAPPGMFTPRWEELQQTYGIERPLWDLR